MNVKTLLQGIAKIMFPAVMVLLIVGTHAFGAIDGFVSRLNIVFPDGSIMFYTGANAGLVAGEEYVMIANGQRVATVRLTRVDAYASNAFVTSSDAPLQEGGVYTFKYMAGTYAPAEAVAPKKVKRLDEAMAPPSPSSSSSKSSTSSSSSGKASSSSRRHSATSSSDSSEDLKTKDEAKEESKTSSRRRSSSSSSSSDSSESSSSRSSSSKSSDSSSSRSSKTSSKPKEEPKPKATTSRGKRHLSYGVARENLTGLIIMPTADTLEEREARFSLGHYRMDGSESYTEAGTSYSYSIHLDNKTTSYYFTYGLTEKTEVSLASRNIKEEVMLGFSSSLLAALGMTIDELCGDSYTATGNYCAVPMSGKSTEVSLKYNFRVSKPDDKTPVDVAAMIGWEKQRYRDQRFGNSLYLESNDTRKSFSYGLIGSVTLSDLATGHIFWGRERQTYHSPSGATSDSTTNRQLAIGLSYKANDLVDVFLEYYRDREPSSSNSSQDWDTTEKSLGIRYRWKDYLLINGAYIWYEEEYDTAGNDLDDRYWLLRADYLL